MTSTTSFCFRPPSLSRLSIKNSVSRLESSIDIGFSFREYFVSPSLHPTSCTLKRDPRLHAVTQSPSFFIELDFTNNHVPHLKNLLDLLICFHSDFHLPPILLADSERPRLLSSYTPLAFNACLRKEARTNRPLPVFLFYFANLPSERIKLSTELTKYPDSRIVSRAFCA